MSRGEVLGDDFSVRSSQGSTETWNNQTICPQPSEEVYIEQAGAPDRPQAPMTGEMRRVMDTIEQQQQALHSSTNSNRSSMSGGGGSGASTPLVDSELLARAGSSGSGAIRREALEALDSEQDCDKSVLRRYGLPNLHDQQQSEHEEEQNYAPLAGVKRRSKKRGQAGVRSQSANAANINVPSAVNMRLPPMSALSLLGSAANTPLGFDKADQMSMGIASGQHSKRLNAPLALGRDHASSSIASRPIHSAPSNIHGRNSIDGSLRSVPDGGLIGGALPPIQSLTPNAKTHKGTQKLM